MGLLSRIAGLFTRNGRDDSLMQQAMDHAKANRPAQAIAIYNSLLQTDTTRSEVRARALFNRALAHSSMKDDEKALADLERVLEMPNLPENVLNAAKAQLFRVRKRAE